MRILIIEDDKELCSTLKRGLAEVGHVVDIVNDGRTGIDFAGAAEYDLIILDIMLPDIHGIEVCRNLRRDKISAPILMLTAKRTIEDRVEGLNAGADDYLCKPFAFEELEARIRAVHRRETTQKSPVIEAAGITMDTVNHTVKVNCKKVELTSTEYRILEYFMSNPNRLLTREMIENHIWDIQKDNEYNTIEVFISRLRRKLGYNVKNCPIKNVYGEGYRFTS
ncbi:MAG: response regulator transcription factor [Dehalococcoidales bacterium]|nr:response regulator transcription factor [Dehalococcoidales bacterium]